MSPPVLSRTQRRRYPAAAGRGTTAAAWRPGATAAGGGDDVGAAAGEAGAGGTAAVGEIAGPDIAAYASLPLRARVFAEVIGFHPQVRGAALVAAGEAVA